MDRSAIRVINKNQFGVALSTRDRNIYLEGTLVNGVPVEEYFTLAELEFINNRTPVVRDGISSLMKVKKKRCTLLSKFRGGRKPVFLKMRLMIC